MKETVDEQFSMEPETLAKAVAEDAWLFRTDGVPAFHTAVDKGPFAEYARLLFHVVF